MGKVIQLGRKVISKAIGRNRQALAVSHLDGKVTASGDNKHLEQEAFTDRMARIQQSLERINELMDQLRNKPYGEGNEDPLESFK